MKNGIVFMIVIAAAITGYALWPNDQMSIPEHDHDMHTSDGSTHDSEPTEPKPQASKAGPWPVAVAGSTTYRFGQMQVGTEKEHIFTIKNEGKASLQLQTGKSTCKCTAFDLSKTQLEVGEETTLTVRWKGKFLDPKFEHGGPVYTNDPNQPTIQFKVKGIVENAVEVLPGGDWNIGNISSAEPGTFEGHIVSKVHQNFIIESIESDSPLLTAEIKEVKEKRLTKLDAIGGHAIHVTVSKEIPAAIFTANLSVKVDCLDKPFDITVKASKTGPIKIMPLPGVAWFPSSNTLTLGQFSVNNGHEAELALLVDQTEMETDLEITETKAKPAFLAAKLSGPAKTNGSFGRYTLKIGVPAGSPPVNRSRINPAVIELHTNHPSGQVLTINVSFRTF